jgi:competence protein ComEC
MGVAQIAYMRAFAFLRAEAMAERARWPLWLPVGMGAGIGVYFALPVEPGWAAAAMAALALAGAGWLAAKARRGGLRLAAMAAAAILTGFCAAKARTEWVRAPVLERKIGPVKFVARVVQAEPRGRGLRLLLQPERIRRLRDGAMPDYVRVSVRYADEVPAPGGFVQVTAVLMPPPGPAMPGDYDFARWAYFHRIGAVGYTYGKPHPVDAPRATGWSEDFQAGLETLRGRMTARIRDAVPGPEGAISAALITGMRADVSPADEVAYRDSGLTHVLSISGVHLALAGGIFFWVVRALLALFPALAQRHPVKKWAALAALTGSAFYLAISGCDPPAVRSFIMLAAMFAAVLADRPALSMRSVALAAVLIVLFEPECVLDAGCQMSFASVVGLIALAEWSAARRAANPDRAGGWLRRASRYLLAPAAVSIVAGLVSAPIAIFHFDRASQYGLLSNLIAEPVVGTLIMPAATAAMVLMPLGLDRWPLIVMGKGVAAMSAIAHWVGGMPGAASLVPVWPLVSLIAVMLGLLWIALWRRSWRWLGVVPVAAGILWAQCTRPPDVLAARDFGAVAVRLTDGKLAFLQKPKDDFAAQSWLKREGDERDAAAALAGPGDGVRCDAIGCIAHARDGSLIAYDLRAEALAEDCGRARIVLSRVPVRGMCRGAFTIDRFDILREGGFALWLGPELRIRTVAAASGIRPWSMPWRPRGGNGIEDDRGTP